MTKRQYSRRTSSYQVIAAGIILVAVGIFIFNTFNKDYDLTYELTSVGIHVTHEGGIAVKSEDFTIAYKDISAIQTLGQFPEHKKVNGIDGKVRIGDFDVDGLGPVKLYAQTTKRPLVLIATAEVIYGLTPLETQPFIDQVEAGRLSAEKQLD